MVLVIIQMILGILLALVVAGRAIFEAEFETLQEDKLSTSIKIGGKEVIENVNLYSPDLSICCKPNRSIFQIVHNFLSNPFFQINEYSCPSQSTSASSEIVLPILGVIQMQFDLIEFPHCLRGDLGLSKNSRFLNYLPINMHAFRIEINKKMESQQKEVKLFFGDMQGLEKKGGILFHSPHPVFWDFTVSQIFIGGLHLESDAKAVLKASGTGLLIPDPFFEKLIKYFPASQTCKFLNDEVFCLCEWGIPRSFPQFILKLGEDRRISIPLESYMSIDSNVCRLMLEPSPDQYWHFDLFLFENTVFYFNKERPSIIIEERSLPSNPSSDFIHLPLQLILNCCVILLLCIFASMVIIELVKRASGLSDARNENIHTFVLRTNLE